MILTMLKPNDVEAIRSSLRAAGYPPVPVETAGKKPVGFAWNKAAKAGKAVAVNGTALNTGILCDGLRVIDIDIDDAELAQEVANLARDLLGEAPERYRDNSGRRTLVYRAAEGEPSKRSVKGRLGAIEVLGQGQQFVAFGKHPSGTDLKWRERPIYEVPRDTIPAITEEELTAFLDAASTVIEAEDRQEPAPAAMPDLPRPQEARRDGRSIEEIEDLLSWIDPGVGYDEWIKVIMAIHAETGGSQEGFSLADEWSSRGANYKGTKDVAGHWKSFGKSGVTGATIAKLARENGADLSEIARKYGAIEAPYFDPAEAQKISDDILAAFERKKAEKVRSDLEWFDDVKPVIQSPYIIKGVIDWGTMSVIYGPSNCGKTFFALDIAYHVAIQAPWRGKRVYGGSVLYLAAEGGNGIANRIMALRETTGSVDVPLALRRAGLDLLNPRADTDHVLRLAKEVEQAGPLALIVVDTLSRVIAGGDENAASDMTAFIKNVDRIRQSTGAHIMIVHHTGKDAAKGARGHSSLRAATDTEIEISSDEFGQRVAKVTKQRDYEGGDEFQFALRPVYLGQDQDGDNVTSCVVEQPAEGQKKAGDELPPMAVCRLILSEIQQAYNKENPYSMTAQSQRTGRYAPRALGKKFNINIATMDRLLKSWIDNEIVMMSKFDGRNNRSGLTVIGEL